MKQSDGSSSPLRNRSKTNICTTFPFSNFLCKKRIETRVFRESRNSSWCCSVTLPHWNSWIPSEVVILTLKSGLSDDWFFLNLAFTGGLLLLSLVFILPFLQGFLHCALTYRRIWGKLWFRNWCCQLVWFELSTAVSSRCGLPGPRTVGKKEKNACILQVGSWRSWDGPSVLGQN